MTHRTHPHRFAGAAIAAVLALGSTPLWAQDIAPVAAPPAPVAAPVTQPTIVLPPVAPAPVAPAPQPVTAASAPEPTAPRAATPRASAPATRRAPAVTAPRDAAPANTASTGVSAAEAPDTAPIDTPAATVAPIEPLPTVQDAPIEETATAAPADGDSGDILPIAGILAALGLGGLALVASRRRRREPDEAEPMIVAHRPNAAPAASAPAFVAPAMKLQQSTQQSQPIWQEPRRAVGTAATAATVGNRQALLDRMVAAEPDANNPFTSAKARRRRARLMLQSMDDQRWDDAELEPGFDWREQARATREHETVTN